MAIVAWVVGRSVPSRLARGATVLVLAAVFTAPSWASVPILALWNTSESAPVGFYVYEHPPPARRGDMVVWRDPPRWHLGWLLKRVEGVVGDLYCWDPGLGTHRLNGRPMPPPAADAIRIGIPVWHGCATLAPGEIVGYGRTSDSYDSRYFGPVREAELWGVYLPVWVDG